MNQFQTLDNSELRSIEGGTSLGVILNLAMEIIDALGSSGDLDIDRDWDSPSGDSSGDTGIDRNW